LQVIIREISIPNAAVVRFAPVVLLQFMMDTLSRQAVPFFDFKAVFAEDPHGFSSVIGETLSSGGIILQRGVEEFEQRLAKFIGSRFAVGVSDCTNAMQLGVRALDIGRGDEVIICSHTFIATAQAVHFAGATPVPVEVQPDRMIDPEAIEPAITPRTRAILLTQLNGRVCDMDRVEAVARPHGLLVLEDSAQALGASFRGRRAGTFGKFGAFSFYPSKLLGGFGDGGALTTDDEGLAERVLRMRNHGANRSKQLESGAAPWSTNSRLDNVHAAVLNYKFANFPATIARRRQIARTYHAAFEDLPDFGRPPGPDESGPHFDVFQNYEIDVANRDGLRAHLQAMGVGTIVQWGGLPVHRMHGLGFTQQLPRTDRFFARCLLVPMNQFLSDADVLAVCSAVRGWYGLSPWRTIAEIKPGDAPVAICA
jgi:dTDP-4-amino-4,6-dideoxygalactose transaminase